MMKNILVVVLLACFSCCSALFIEQEIFSMEGWKYLGRFGMYPKKIQGTLSGNLAYKVEHNETQDLKLMVFLGQSLQEFGLWLEESNSCQNVVGSSLMYSLGSNYHSDVEVVEGGYWKKGPAFEGSFFRVKGDISFITSEEKDKRKWMYVVLARCDVLDPWQQGHLDAKISLHFTNSESSHNYKEYSADQFGMVAIHASFTFLQIILIIGGLLTNASLKNENQNHVTFSIFFYSIAVKFVSSLVLTFVWMNFSTTGSLLQVASI